MPRTHRIEKRRYLLMLPGNFMAEIHVHDGHLAGFSYGEVECVTMSQILSPLMVWTRSHVERSFFLWLIGTGRCLGNDKGNSEELVLWDYPHHANLNSKK